MTRGKLSGRVARLEDEARQKESPVACYLRDLLAFIGFARDARQTGDEEKAEKARAMRDSLEDRARGLE